MVCVPTTVKRKMSSRYQTKRPRSMGKAVCCLPNCGSPATRMDFVGRPMCNTHGQRAARHTRNTLFDQHPQIAVLLHRQPKLTWLRGMLRADIVSRLDRYTIADATPQRVVPYAAHKNPRRTQKRKRGRSLCCTVCRTEFVAGEGRSSIRPWYNGSEEFDLCRACHSRTRRTHARANTQFNQLIAVVRGGAMWLVPKLNATLARRVAEYLNATTHISVDSVDGEERRWV